MGSEYPTGKPTIDFPFAAIPADLIYDHEVSSTAVRIYGVLARVAFEEGAANVQLTHEEIAERLHCSPRSVARPLCDLEARGWIERRKSNTWMGRGPDHYHLRANRAELRTGEAQRANSRGDDRAESRTPTSLKEVRENTDAQVLDIATPTKRESLEADFDEWYKTYPRKKKPADARRAYVKARKKATKDELLLGARALERLVANQQQELRFTPYPASWLNSESWLEEPDAEPNPFEPPPMRFG